MNSRGFAWRSLYRDLKAGELTILLFAIIVAVTSMTAVGFFTDRVSRAVEAQAAETLAADLVIRSPARLDERYLQKLSLIHISEPTRRTIPSRMPSSA